MHFPPSGKIPDSLFFSMPQYNTWIELLYNQNQNDIEQYANSILDNKYPTGVLMIDDNWQKYYGNFEFKPDRFSNPKGMVDKLHKQGFRVMLWVCTFVSPDSPEYRELAQKGYLIKKKGTKTPAIIDWWNGQSACFDFSNPEAVDYFVNQLKQLQLNYGIDGFKLDAGDVLHYLGDLDFYSPSILPVEMSEKWAEIGLHFNFNEYRACWKMGGQALVQRLGDKNYSWNSVKILIPNMIAAGLVGYSYTCPDMIGGGQFGSFIGVKDFDQELIVRSCQTHALMPMMQFSVAPWRILDAEHNELCRKFANLHASFSSYILKQARHSAKTGEPIVRHMEYMYPHQGFSDCKDQYMLGDEYLVTPMIEKGFIREVKLPTGKWKDDQGNVWKGGKTVRIDVPIGRLPYFIKIK